MILVTGGAGFIGGNFVLDWLAGCDEPVVNLDLLTYAGNLETLSRLANHPGHHFIRGDIGDAARRPCWPSTSRVPSLILRQKAMSIAPSQGLKTLFKPILSARFDCLKRCARTGLACLPHHKRPFVFCMSLPMKCMARSIKPRPRSPKTTATSLIALFGQQGGIRSLGAGVSSHLRPAGAHHQLLQQLWPLPFP